MKHDLVYELLGQVLQLRLMCIFVDLTDFEKRGVLILVV